MEAKLINLINGLFSITFGTIMRIVVSFSKGEGAVKDTFEEEELALVE